MTLASPRSSNAPQPAVVLRPSGTVTVYEAVLGCRPVIVKRLREPCTDETGKRRFAREKHLASVLCHPALPSLVDEGDDWFALERLDCSLADLSRGGFSAPNSIASLFGRLAAALAYVHGRGVAHLDIKPAHIMFRGEDPVLIDFGIAGLMTDDPISGIEISGSPAWMAPEQLHGRVGPFADIWSLCAVCLWLLTGRRLFTGAAEEVLTRRTAGAGAEIDAASFSLPGHQDLIAMITRGLAPSDCRPTAAEIANRFG